MTGASEAVLVPGAGTPEVARARLWAFRVMLALAVLLLAAPMAPFLIIPVGWPFLGEQLGVHQFHDVGVASLLWLLLVGLLAQLRRPVRQVGAMQQTLIVALLMLGATAIARPATLLSPLLVPLILAYGVAAVHPARREVARIRWRLDPVVAGFVAVAAGPLLAFARQQLSYDFSALPVVAHGGHWTTMATLATAIPVLALFSATRPRGWRVPAWSAGAAAILFGVASFALDHRPSSVGPIWSALAVGWGAGFIVLSELRQRARPRADDR